MKALPILALVAALGAAPAHALEKPRNWMPPPPEQVPNHRQHWRDVVTELAAFLKGRQKDFIVLAHGGVELLVKGDREAKWEEIRDPDGLNFEKRLPAGSTYRPYLRNLDGLVVNGLYCGEDAFGKPLDQAIKDRRDLDRQIAEDKARGIQRPAVPQPLGPFSIDPKEELRKAAEVRRNAERLERQRRMAYALDAVREAGRRVMSIDHCDNPRQAEAAGQGADRDRVLTHAATGNARLDTIPRGGPRAENAQPVRSLTTARNWLPMLSSARYGSKAEWLMALERTNHDLVAIPPTWRGAEALTKEEVRKLKFKELGTPRLVVAVLPVGKAHDTGWYWQKGWEAGNPPFLFAPIADEPGAFMTDVNDPQWKKALGQFVTWLQDLGFDGIMLTDLDTYLWFEELMPLEG